MKKFGSALLTSSLFVSFAGCSNVKFANSNLGDALVNELGDSLIDTETAADDSALGLGGFPTMPFASSFVVASGRGQILAPERCGNQIGAGANYVEGSTRLAGKCNNGGLPVRKITDAGDTPYLHFETDGSAKKATDLSESDRSELAYTPMIPFGKTVGIGYQFRIPRNSARNAVAYSAIQFWQCASAAPIGVMQVDHDDNRKAENRGLPYNSYRSVNFITRDYKNKQVEIKKVDFPEDTWHDVRIIARIEPTDQGRFQVWFNNQLVGDSQGPSGIANTSICPNKNFRVKFGIYKSNEPGRKFKLHYRNFRMTEETGFSNKPVAESPAEPIQAVTTATPTQLQTPSAQGTATEQPTLARCLVRSYSGETLFDNERQKEVCVQKCDEFANYPRRTCLWNGQQLR